MYWFKQCNPCRKCFLRGKSAASGPNEHLRSAVEAETKNCVQKFNVLSARFDATVLKMQQGGGGGMQERLEFQLLGGGELDDGNGWTLKGCSYPPPSEKALDPPGHASMPNSITTCVTSPPPKKTLVSLACLYIQRGFRAGGCGGGWGLEHPIKILPNFITCLLLLRLSTAVSKWADTSNFCSQLVSKHLNFTFHIKIPPWHVHYSISRGVIHAEITYGKDWAAID